MLLTAVGLEERRAILIFPLAIKIVSVCCWILQIECDIRDNLKECFSTLEHFFPEK
jgi:hypothetical protein